MERQATVYSYWQIEKVAGIEKSYQWLYGQHCRDVLDVKYIYQKIFSPAASCRLLLVELETLFILLV